MKTAEEWEIMKQLHVPLPRTTSDLIYIIKQIQLDAWKQGMLDAVKDLNREGNEEQGEGLHWLIDSITEEANNRKEI